MPSAAPNTVSAKKSDQVGLRSRRPLQMQMLGNVAEVSVHQSLCLITIPKVQCRNDCAMVIVAAIGDAWVTVHSNNERAAGYQVFDNSQQY